MQIDKTLWKNIETKLNKLNKMRPISSPLAKKLQERFEIEMTYNSNAIEGNTLTLKETYWVIQDGLTVKNKPLKDHLEAKNHKNALDFLYELIEHDKQNTISEKLIKDIHSLVIEDTNKKAAGRYREVDVFITGADHKPVSALEVKNEMSKLIKWARNNCLGLNPIEFAAIFHHKFVHIHPFEDGNGRTARILMNIFLMQSSFPLSIIQKNDRKKYYSSLSMADAGKYENFINFIAQSVMRSLNIYLDTITPASKKEQFISLAEAAKHSQYSQEYLGKLAKAGKIEAHKEKRNWLTTKEAIKRYEKSIRSK